MTTPVPIPKLLKEFLDELDEETLKEFQWNLVQINIDGSRPIPKSKLERATRVETVDKLVEAFGEDGAVERTVDTFFRMNLRYLAYKLIQAIVDQSLEQKEEESETSSAREKPREADPIVLKDLSCSICLNLFTDPVVLQCGHSFCRSCVHKYWERNIVRECSLCKQVIPEGDPPINFSLKSLCENHRGRSQDEPSGHRNNTETFQFQTPPENIREKQKALKEVKQLYDSSIERIKTQSFNTEKEITDDFKMLHASLNEEEKTRRAALRKEARLKIRKIHLMHEKVKITCLLSDTMAEIENSGADKSFIETRETEALRISSQEEINVSKHLENLQLEVLKKMLNNINQTGTDVGHENEDSSRPSAFDFWSKMKFNDAQQRCPGNPERSTHYQQNLQKSPKRRRVEQDSKNGKVSVHDHDYYKSMLTHEGTQSSGNDFPEAFDIMHVPCLSFPYEDEDDDEEDEDEQRPSERKVLKVRRGTWSWK